MPLVSTQDLTVAVSKELNAGLPEAVITTPTWLRPPLTEVTLNLDQSETRDNAGRIGAGDEFPTESRILRWTQELTLRFEGNVEFLDYFITKFMGVKTHTLVGTSHRKSTPAFLNPTTAGRTPKLFEMLLSDGIEKRRLTSCMVQAVRISVPEMDRCSVEVVVQAIDNVDGSNQTMPSTEQAVHYLYANNAGFTSIGDDYVTAAKLRSFNLAFEQDLPQEIRYVIGGGHRGGVIGAGAVPKRAIFANRRVTASFTALYESNSELTKVRAQTTGSLLATFRGEPIPNSSPAANYQFEIYCPKVRYQSATAQNVGNVRTLDVAIALLKQTASGPDQNVLIAPEILTVLAADFDFS